MSAGRHRAGMLAAAIAAVLAGCAAAPASAASWAFDEDDGYARQPPLTLPEGINGVLRATAPPIAVGRIETIRDVFAAVRACWRPPARGPSGQQITPRFAIKRSGDVIGTPRITYYRPGGSEEQRNLFTRSVRQAFAACLPLPLSPRLAAAVAGRPFTFRFIDDRPI